MLVKCPKCQIEYDVSYGKFECVCGEKFIVSDKGVVPASRDDVSCELSDSADFATSTPCGSDEKTHSHNYLWLVLTILLILLVSAGASGVFVYYRHKVLESDRVKTEELKSLKEENRAIEDEIKRLKEEQLANENKRLKEEKSIIEEDSKRLKEEKSIIEDENKRLEEEKLTVEEQARRVGDERQSVEEELQRLEEEKRVASMRHLEISQNLQKDLIFSAAQLLPCLQKDRPLARRPYGAYGSHRPYSFSSGQENPFINLNAPINGMTCMFTISDFPYLPNDIFEIRFSRGLSFNFSKTDDNYIIFGRERFYCSNIGEGNIHTVLVVASSKDIQIYVDKKCIGSRPGDKLYDSATITSFLTHVRINNVNLWRRRLSEDEIQEMFAAVTAKDRAQGDVWKITPHTLSSNVGPDFTVSQSANSDAAYHAMDAQKSLNGCHITGSNPWWRIDFDKPVLIGQVVWDYVKQKKDKEIDAVFQGSNDGQHWTVISHMTSRASREYPNASYIRRYSDNFNNNTMPYRHYRLISAGELRIVELEIIYKEMPDGNGKAAERRNRSKAEKANASERNVASVIRNTSTLTKVNLDSAKSVTIEIGVDNSASFNFIDGALVASNYDNIGTHPDLKRNNRRLYFGRPACYVNGKIWELGNRLKISPTPIRITDVKLLHSSRKSVSVSKPKPANTKSQKKTAKKKTTKTTLRTSKNQITWTPSSIRINDTESGSAYYRIKVYFDTI